MSYIIITSEVTKVQLKVVGSIKTDNQLDKHFFKHDFMRKLRTFLNPKKEALLIHCKVFILIDPKSLVEFEANIDTHSCLQIHV